MKTDNVLSVVRGLIKDMFLDVTVNFTSGPTRSDEVSRLWYAQCTYNSASEGGVERLLVYGEGPTEDTAYADMLGRVMAGHLATSLVKSHIG